MARRRASPKEMNTLTFPTRLDVEFLDVKYLLAQCDDGFEIYVFVLTYGGVYSVRWL